MNIQDEDPHYVLGVRLCTKHPHSYYQIKTLFTQTLMKAYIDLKAFHADIVSSSHWRQIGCMIKLGHKYLS